ncbi:MAG: cytochrome c oxidase assembly protein [Pseudomonadota bacterium]
MDRRGVSGQGARNARTALFCAAIFAGMVGAAFVSVPLYRAFCQATGFNGTAKRARAAPAATSARSVVVRFDTNVRGLAWRFQPAQPRQSVKLGETKLAFFRATNMGSAPVTGRALYNVLPESAGPYFSKLECFCFKNQTIGPGETVEFPVAYFVDPRYGADPDTKGAGEITLSYTFLPAVTGARATAAQTPRRGAPSALGG